MTVADEAHDEVRVCGVPLPFRWSGMALPVDTHAGNLSITAGPGADWFVDPASGAVTRTASALLGVAPHDEFTFTARVAVDLAAGFDAGSLVVWVEPDRWAKLAHEVTAQGHPMVVSVVTRGRSDAARSGVVDTDSVWLQLCRQSDAYAFHASTDGHHWWLVRHFHLGPGPCKIGFLTQSPRGRGCRAEFSSISYLNAGVDDLHDPARSQAIEFVVDHAMPAPIERVWQAWTQPEQFTRWFGGTPDTVTLDVRPGGSWRVVMDPDEGSDSEILTGRYLDVVENRLLVMETHFAGGDTVMEMSFHHDPSAPSSSRVAIHQRCRSLEERDGAREGSLALLRACAAY